MTTDGVRNGSGWIVKTFLGVSLTIIITLLGYLHLSTVSYLQAGIQATKDQTAANVVAMDARLLVVENRLLATDGDAYKRNARLDVLERDASHDRASTAAALQRIETSLSDLTGKVDALRFPKTKE